MLYGMKARLKELYEFRKALEKMTGTVDVYIGRTPIGIPVNTVSEEAEKEIAFLEKTIKEAEGA